MEGLPERGNEGRVGPPMKISDFKVKSERGVDVHGTLNENLY